jgi:ABC-type multidrug transport system permease subunit
MFRGLPAIFYKETIHILRDPKTLFLIMVIPGLQLTIFGYAIDFQVDDVATVVYNLDGREASRAFIDKMENSGTFKVVYHVFSNEEFTHALIKGKARVGVKFPPDYSDDLLVGRSAQIQLLIDGSDSTVATQALNVATAIGLRESISIMTTQLNVGGAQPIDMRPRMLFNPDMRTARFTVPGLVGIVMQVVTMMLTAFAVVREKETGTFEQLMVTPVSPLGLMVGKLAPYCVIGASTTTMVLLIMRFLFQVPIAGSVLLLATFSLTFLFTALGLGLLISTIATNQVQAMQFAFLIMLPSVLLSGFMFPQESMPFPIYVIGQFIPVTYFIRILRGIILRGAGFGDLWQNAAILAAFGLVLLTLSTKRLHKTLA